MSQKSCLHIEKGERREQKETQRWLGVLQATPRMPPHSYLE